MILKNLTYPVRWLLHTLKHADERIGFSTANRVTISRKAIASVLPEKPYVRDEVPLLLYGGGTYGIRKDRLLIEGSGEGGGTVLDRSEGQTVGAGMGRGSIAVGYMLLHTPGLRIYPLIGFGGGGGGAGSRPKTVSLASGPMLHLGFGIELCFGPMIAGLRGGLWLSLFGSEPHLGVIVGFRRMQNRQQPFTERNIP